MVNIDPILYIGISQSFFSGLLDFNKKTSDNSEQIDGRMALHDMH